MYLCKINPITGLVELNDETDGIYAIESFREVLNKPGYGIQAFTCVALVVDYGSLLARYSEKERPLKAMEIVFNDRKAITWFSDEIQLACINYKQLQFNAALQEKTLLDELRINKLEEIKEETESFKKTSLLRELNSINDLHEAFEKKNSTKDLFAESPIRNGYKLSRLEIKITDKKSFYYERKKREQRESESSDIEPIDSGTTDKPVNRARTGKPKPKSNGKRKSI